MYWVEALFLQLLLQAPDVSAQAGTLALKTLGVATGPGEAGDAIGCATLGVVLCARRAAAGLGIAADLPDLAGEVLLVYVLRIAYCKMDIFHTLHLSQACPVRLEAPFLRACVELWGMALAPGLSYSTCSSLLLALAGRGAPASPSVWRFAGIAGERSRGNSTTAVGWYGNFRLSSADAASYLESKPPPNVGSHASERHGSKWGSLCLLLLRQMPRRIQP